MGWLYGVAATSLWALFAAQAWRLRSDDRPGAAMGVFRYSIYYLALLFVAVAADQLVLG
jgi:protoheme IX farnesyltransferase